MTKLLLLGLLVACGGGDKKPVAPAPAKSALRPNTPEACKTFFARHDKVVACTKLEKDAHDAFLDAITNVTTQCTGAEPFNDADLASVKDTCEVGMQGLDQGLGAAGC